MEISSNFNRFYHSAVLAELFRKCGTLRFPLWVDTVTGAPLEFVKGEHFNDVDDLKQILKSMNLDYKLSDDENGKISTKDINVYDLMAHIDYCIYIAGYNHIEFKFVRDEWERLARQYEE